jgi:DNA-directed RNA polymerase specialized sigma24 family protein
MALAVAGGAIGYLLLPDSSRQWWDAYHGAAAIASGGAVAGLVAVVAAIVVVQAARRRPARHWLWAGLLLALPGGWLGPVSFDRPLPWLPLEDYFHVQFGRLAQVLLASCVVLAIMVWLGGTGRPTRLVAAARPARLTVATSVLIGCGAGFASIQLVPALFGSSAVATLEAPGDLPGAAQLVGAVVYLCWLLAATAWILLPPGRLGTTLATFVVAETLVASLGWLVLLRRNGFPSAAVGAVLALMAAVALCGALGSAADRRREGRIVLGSAACTLLAAAAVEAYENGWRLPDMVVADSLGLLDLLLLGPLALVAVTGIAALRRPVPGGPFGGSRLRRAAAWAMVSISVCWIALMSLPYVASFGPVLLLTAGGGVLGCAAWAVLAWRRARDPLLEQRFREYAVAGHARLLATAYLLTGDRAAAERAVETALARVFVVWRRCPETAVADAVARRALVQAASRAAVAAGQAPGGDGSVDGALWERVRALPARERTVLVLRYHDNLTPAEIAGALDCSIADIEHTDSAILQLWHVGLPA